MVIVTDAGIIGEGADDEQVELIGPGPVLDAQAGLRVDEAQALGPLAATVALPGPVPQKCRYAKRSSQYD
jgi:hypothetical protein